MLTFQLSEAVKGKEPACLLACLPACLLVRWTCVESETRPAMRSGVGGLDWNRNVSYNNNIMARRYCKRDSW